MSLVPHQTRVLNNFFLDVFLNKVEKHISMNIFGRNPDISSSAVEDISDVGDIYVPPTEGRIHSITSSSLDDSSSGTGAQSVRIFGLDLEGLEVSENISLNGTANVSTVNLYTAINQMIVVAAGSGGVNAGIITATAQTDGSLTAQINVGNNITLTSIFTVASNKDFVISHVYFGLNKAGGSAGNVDIGIIISPPGLPDQVRAVFGAFSDGTSFGNLGDVGLGTLAGGTRFKAIGTASANNTDVFFGYQGILVTRD